MKQTATPAHSSPLTGDSVTVLEGRPRNRTSNSPEAGRVAPAGAYDQAMTTAVDALAAPLRLRFLALEITGRCQLTCSSHCYAEAGPTRGHGSMTLADWLKIIDEAAALGTETVQLIGGCSRGRRVPRRSCRFRLGRRGPVVLP
ncbi:radical SAM protein [Streptomyces niveus]|uniref:radical SAM protein n=1 Tax=Streptomyces niveus TaxID=193462 RepID=UPI0036BEF997